MKSNDGINSAINREEFKSAENPSMNMFSDKVVSQDLSDPPNQNIEGMSSFINYLITKIPQVKPRSVKIKKS